MAETRDPQAFLDACSVTPDVFELRPDYRAQLLVIQGLDPTGSQVADTGAVDELILAAEEHARRLTEETAVTDLAHINAWREAYRAFGAKPQRTRNSLEALTRRAQNGLPRVNALTDIYNAISVLHQLPLGGEDFQHYEGPARLTRAAGEEPFDTSANGETVIEHPEPGEVIWGDDAGVTCRRWNWRQCRRTGLSEETTSALFILDALSAVTDDQLTAAGDALADALADLGTDVHVNRRLIRG